MSYSDCFGAGGLASATSPAGPPDTSGVFIGAAGCCCGEDVAVAAPTSAARCSAVGGLTLPVLVFRSREQRYRAVSEGDWVYAKALANSTCCGALPPANASAAAAKSIIDGMRRNKSPVLWGAQQGEQLTGMMRNVGGSGGGNVDGGWIGWNVACWMMSDELDAG